MVKLKTKMKLTIIFFLLSFSAFGQTPFNDIASFPDTSNMEKRHLYSYAKQFAPQGEIRSDLFNLKWKDIVDLKLNTGGLINYQPRSDNGTSTDHRTMIRILASHIPINADIKLEELLLVQNLINEVVKPGVYTPRTEPTAPILKTTINDHNNTITYSNGWVKAAGQSWTEKFNNVDVSYTYTVGSSATMSFTGRRVEVIAERCDNHTPVKIEISKGTEIIDTKIIDTYLNTGGNANNVCPAGVVSTIFISDILQHDTYSIKVSLESKDMTKIPARDSFVFDGFKVYE
jgi:hypothetical protein